MNNARKTILAAIERATGRESDAPSAAAAHRDELPALANPRPSWSNDRITRFCEELRAASASLESLSGLGEIPGAIERYLGAHELHAGQVDVAPHPDLRVLKWHSDWDVNVGKPRGDSLIGVSRALCAVAETGTLMLASSPSSLNFLPDYHFVALTQGDVVDYLEDAWAVAREHAKFPPRTLNLVTGPSRTADIEQTLQIGAHGPRRLHVMLIDSDSA